MILSQNRTLQNGRLFFPAENGKVEEGVKRLFPRNTSPTVFGDSISRFVGEFPSLLVME